MITLLVEVVLAVLLVLVLVQFMKKRSAPPPAPALPQADLANLKPTDARAGDVISIAGAGDNMNDLDFTVDRAVAVQAGSRSWTELNGGYRERRVALRVRTSDDGLTVAIQDGARQMTIDDLGLSEDDLGQLDERQNPADNFIFDDKTWQYRISREAQAVSEGRPQTSYYYWEFQEQGGNGLITVKKLEGEPFSVALWKSIPSGDVTVYRGAAR
jgi:hypothetical protein